MVSGTKRSPNQEGLAFHRLRPSWPGLHDGDWQGQHYYGPGVHVHLRSSWPSRLHITTAQSHERRQQIGRRRAYDVVRITVSLVVVAAIIAAAIAYGR
jgi:hypothetical protein